MHWLKANSWRLHRALYVLAAVGCAAIILYVGFDLRTQGMTPLAEGLLYLNDYDEGVYSAGAQLWLQGYTPYRDYFFPQSPLALLLYAAVLQLHFVPWGDATAFMLERYAASAFGLFAIALVFISARRLGGTLAGLMAAGVLALDAMVVHIDRRALLEPYLNAFSTLAMLAYLSALTPTRGRRVWLLTAGALGACAALVKTIGALALCAILVHAAGRIAFAASGDARRARLREWGILWGGAALPTIVFTAYFFVTAPVEFLRQVYLFQLYRPGDGALTAAERFGDILGGSSSHLTVYLALAGVGIIFLRGVVQKKWGAWSLILLWAGAIVAAFAVSKTYFPHYYVQLAAPLAILAGALVSRPESTDVPTARRRPALILAAQVGVVLLFVVLDRDAALAQYARAQAVAAMQSPSLRDVGEFLTAHTPPNARVLVFQPDYAFVASREPLGRATAHL